MTSRIGKLLRHRSTIIGNHSRLCVWQLVAFGKGGYRVHLLAYGYSTLLRLRFAPAHMPQPAHVTRRSSAGHTVTSSSTFRWFMTLHSLLQTSLPLAALGQHPPRGPRLCLLLEWNSRYCTAPLNKEVKCKNQYVSDE